MYLKSMEIQGFKSFANKIRFDFNSGMTGIVGPNGSGKSNVADAVRWVFGEQSAKQLRGGSMQDVIFSGTAIRKAQSFASVSMTLDNEDHSLNIDYPVVTVTRKLYRSGESEYMLNGSICRLKDIQELFYDTGIGKEGYSVIGQTQIDKILSGKPDDRRELFDEAAGIVKFKKRKAVALRRLEDERANMVRVTDILSELEKQVGPLKRQSETAKQYLLYRDELKVYDLNAFLLDQDTMGRQLSETEEKLRLVVDNLADLNSQAEALVSEYSDLEEEIKDMDEKAEQVRSRVQEASEEKSAIDVRINVLKEQIHTEEISAEHINARLTAIDQEIGGRENERDKARDGILKERTELSDIEAALSEKRKEVSETELHISLLRQSIEESHGKVVDLLKEQSGITAKLQHYETVLEQNGIRQEETEKEVSEGKKRLLELENNLKLLTESFQNAEKEADERQTELSELQAEMTEAEEERSTATRLFHDLSSELQVTRSKLETLKNLRERYEGYNSAVKKIMEERKRFSGIEGVVADLIQVDTKYQTAIETVLGANIQNIVTTRESDAKKLIDFLKENHAGRATFLPLDTIRSSGGVPQEALREKGIIGTADSLVAADSKYDEVVKYLLGRFIVAEDFECASRTAAKYKQSLRIVTLGGEFFNVGGSLSGGSFRNSSNLLSRSSEISELEEKAKKIMEQVNVQNRTLSRLKQMIDSTSVEVEDAQEEANKAAIAVERIRMETDSRTREKQMLELSVSEAESRLTEVLSEAADAKREMEIIAKYAEELENQNSESDKSQDAMQTELSSFEAQFEQLKNAENELTLKAASLKQHEVFLQETDERLKNEIYKLSEEKNTLAANIDVSTETIEGYRAEIEGLLNEEKDSSQRLSDLDGTLKSILREKEILTSSQHEYFEKRNALSDDIEGLNKEQIILENQRDRLDEKLNVQTEYLWTEYSLTPSEAVMFRDESMTSAGSVRRHVSELKKNISGLGHVNVNAIEQYKEVSERYEFLKSQYDDLIEAEKTLASIVDELDEGMRKQFAEKFKDIQSEFDKVFKELFGGGQGTLTLNAAQDLIDSDISIIAQPPGKKLQNMMQLSNGEKALTAIALIFAIQNLKPSPFCLLDEIEAALDESNVGRFTGYLRKLTSNTQFIVITHRRGTMTAADRLYGITMQEKGVSALVSVNLVADDLDA